MSYLRNHNICLFITISSHLFKLNDDIIFITKNGNEIIFKYHTIVYLILNVF